MNNVSPQTNAPSLAASFAALRGARQRDDLITALQHALQQHTHAHVLQAVWLVDGHAAPLFVAPALPAPRREEQAALAAGTVVQHDALTYLPMLVNGTLRGWAALEHAKDVHAAQLLVDHASALLAVWDGTPPSGSNDAARPAHGDRRSQQLTVLDEISNQLRTATNAEQISTIVASAIRMLTNTPRMLVYLIDPQREWATLQYHEGLDDADSTVRVPTMRVGEGQHVLGQRYAPLGQHVYRARQRFPDSPFEKNTLLILSDQLHAPVGSVIFDLVDYAQPVDDSFVQTLEVLANGAASALRTTWLVDEQQRTVDRLMALNAFSLAATNTKLTPAELLRLTVSGMVGTTQGTCGGALLHEDAAPTYSCECATATTCAASIEAHVAENGNMRPFEWEGDDVPASARAAGVGSVICVPLAGTNRTYGHVWVAYGSRVVVPAHREMVVLYAKMAGAVLEHRHLFNALRTAHDRFAAIMAASDEGMLLVAASGEVLVANTALHRLLDLPRSSLTHTPVDLVLHHVEHHHGDAAELAAALHDVAHGTRTAAHGEFHRAAPTPRDLVWTVVPVAESDAEAALLLLRDVTTERQASKLREDLTHMVVHDLRAPLANMIASLDLLLKQRVGPLTPRQARIAQIASDGSHHMTALVDALLDTRRLERWQWEMCKELHVLYPLVQQLCEQWEQVAGARGITLLNNTAVLPPLFIDSDLVRRVLQNVLDNAVKFSSDNGVVQIDGSVADHPDLPEDHKMGRWAQIKVIDSGPGVPSSYRSHIFELFGQVPQRRSGGSGVGLAFCKLAVEAHGGMIWVDDAPNGGAAFTFTLPVA